MRRAVMLCVQGQVMCETVKTRKACVSAAAASQAGRLEGSQHWHDRLPPWIGVLECGSCLDNWSHLACFSGSRSNAGAPLKHAPSQALARPQQPPSPALRTPPPTPTPAIRAAAAATCVGGYDAAHTSTLPAQLAPPQLPPRPTLTRRRGQSPGAAHRTSARPPTLACRHSHPNRWLLVASTHPDHTHSSPRSNSWSSASHTTGSGAGSGCRGRAVWRLQFQCVRLESNDTAPPRAAASHTVERALPTLAAGANPRPAQLPQHRGCAPRRPGPGQRTLPCSRRGTLVDRPLRRHPPAPSSAAEIAAGAVAPRELARR